MTQKDKELLLRDLSARLSYGVICDCLHDYHTKVSAIDSEDLTVYYPYCDEWESIEYCKPYLRPMSSMTEEECSELKLLNDDQCDVMPTFEYITIENYRIYDWLNRHYFDYRGLIDKGLAIAVTEENNPYGKDNNLKTI